MKLRVVDDSVFDGEMYHLFWKNSGSGYFSISNRPRYSTRHLVVVRKLSINKNSCINVREDNMKLKVQEGYLRSYHRNVTICYLM